MNAGVRVIVYGIYMHHVYKHRRARDDHFPGIVALARRKLIGITASAFVHRFAYTIFFVFADELCIGSELMLKLKLTMQSHCLASKSCYTLSPSTNHKSFYRRLKRTVVHKTPPQQSRPIFSSVAFKSNHSGWYSTFLLLQLKSDCVTNTSNSSSNVGLSFDMIYEAAYCHLQCPTTQNLMPLLEFVVRIRTLPPHPKLALNSSHCLAFFNIGSKSAMSPIIEFSIVLLHSIFMTAALALLIAALYTITSDIYKWYHLPPGPIPFPFLGNIRASPPLPLPHLSSH